jgi:hypothetical protein
VARGRNLFARGDVRTMVLTERAHFYNRWAHRRRAPGQRGRALAVVLVRRLAVVLVRRLAVVLVRRLAVVLVRRCQWCWCAAWPPPAPPSPLACSRARP